MTRILLADDHALFRQGLERVLAEGFKDATFGHAGDTTTALSISVQTVSTYRARIMEKMRLETNADLTQYALDHGLIGSLKTDV